MRKVTKYQRPVIAGLRETGPVRVAVDEASGAAYVACHNSRGLRQDCGALLRVDKRGHVRVVLRGRRGWDECLPCILVDGARACPHSTEDEIHKELE